MIELHDLFSVSAIFEPTQTYMKIYIFLFALLSLSVSVCAQENTSVPSTAYPPDGVYFSFSAFRNAKPDLIKTQLIKSVYSGDFTIKQWSNTENLFFTDPAGTKQSVVRESIWGFAENGTLYLHLGNKFHRISLLGQISYFLESYPVIKGNMAPVVTETKATATYRMLDMETGDIVDYTVENLQELLAPDENLFNEFKAITSAKQKKKKMYSFMERFNTAHPLRAISE